MIFSAPSAWTYHNDFLDVFIARGDAAAACYRTLLQDLRDCGALRANLSGSGASCFGVFADELAAVKAAEQLARRWAFVKVTH